MSISQEKSTSLSAIKDMHASALNYITDNATPEDRDTWAAKETASIAVLEGSAEQSQVDMLTYECQFSDEDLISLAMLIVTNAKLFRRGAGLISGVCQKYKRRVVSSTSISEVQNAPLECSAMLIAMGLWSQ